MSEDHVSARELELFIKNDSQLYHQQYQPIQKNLRTKQARGEYSHERAEKAFENLANTGARKYGKEHMGGEHEGLRVFTPTTRRAVARSLRDQFERESELGNYDYLLPKKYRDQKTSATRAMEKER